MLSKMCYLSQREGFINAKVRKRIQIKEIFSDKNASLCPKT